MFNRLLHARARQRPGARRALARALTLVLCAAAGPALPQPAPPAAGLQLHRPSPDWRDQVLYFVLTDRFDDGNPANNDQGAGEFRAGSRAHYNGGDLAGLQRRLGYIQGLGATGVWLTPPVLNQWWDGRAQYGGYHGYWAAHLKQVDPHLGTLDDYRALSDALHRRGMTLVQDIVVNHLGNFFDHGSSWRRDDPAASWAAHPQSRPMPRPTQAPFDLNDPRDAAQRRAGIYHWTPDVRDYAVREQALNWQMSGLDDLNTENPVVRRALRDSYGFWVREVGVDAFRVDTAFYVPPAFFDDFLHSRDPAAPGIQQVARATGRRHFLSFGEGFAIDKPFQTRATRQIEAYATGPGGRPRLDGMLNFPLYGSLGAVMARGAAPAELGHRITSLMRQHRQPHLMPSFVDNHDVDRFLAGGSEAALKQALLAVLTLPGIPVIYYGTEQGFREPRAAMFAAGHASGGRDHFDTTAPLYRWLQRSIALRRDHPVLSRGRPTVLQADTAGPGVLAWRMDPPTGAAAHGQAPLLVLMNTAEHPALASGLPTGAQRRTPLPVLYTLDDSPGAASGAASGASSGAPSGTATSPAFGTPAVTTTITTVTTADDGRLSLVLPASSALVLQLPTGPARLPAPHGRAYATAPQLLGLQPQAGSSQVRVHGRATPGQAVQVVADSQLPQAVATQADPQGRWQAVLDSRRWVDARVAHRVVAWSPDSGLASPARTLRLQRPWQPVLQQDDPAGDDHGPAGSGLHYRYPTDPSWGPNRQMDLRGLRVAAAGDALQLDLPLHRITRSWNPAHGFDHVAVTVFIGDPRREGGATVMPLQDGTLPGGMRWHWRLRVHGWSNALFSADGASATSEGTALSPGAAVQVDAARHTLRLTLPGGLFGDVQGLQLYVTTWDYDGGYRALNTEPGGHTLGGGPGPKVMDDIGPVSLPAPGRPRPR